MKSSKYKPVRYSINNIFKKSNNISKKELYDRILTMYANFNCDDIKNLNSHCINCTNCTNCTDCVNQNNLYNTIDNVVKKLKIQMICI